VHSSFKSEEGKNLGGKKEDDMFIVKRLAQLAVTLS
jgi:hypothetical protein